MASKRSSYCSGADCVEVELQPDGTVKFGVTSWPAYPLYATAAEWDAFVAGVKAGEFDRVALR